MADTVATTATGATRLVEMLDRLGVELVFGLPGVHNLPIWKALSESGIRLVGVRHEQTAAYAADGYARSTGKLGVALVTTGPGAANTLGGVGEAMAAGSPVLVIATDVSTALRREGVYRGTLHETRDQTAMFAPVTKAALSVGAAQEIGEAVLRAGAAALSAPTGPVYLGIPTNLLSQPVTGKPVSPPAPAQPPPIGPALIDRTCRLLAGAERPLIWTGGGALRAGAGPAVGELALRLAAPVLTTYMGRGLLPPDHPCAVPGPAAAREVGDLWDEADVVVAIGTDFDGTNTQNWQMPAPPALISINVDEADANKSYTSDVTLVGDARAVVEALLRAPAPTREGLPELERRLASIGSSVAAWIADDDEQAAALLEIFSRALPPETVVVADMCIPGYWLGGYWRVPRPRKLGYPLGWGTLGFGFPASLGAGLAGVGPTVCVTGDGGFMYACGELATVVEAQIPVTIVLIEDGGYGMLRYDQVQSGEEPFGVDLVQPDFAALAASFGVPASAFDGFSPEFERALVRSVANQESEMLIVRAALKPPPTTSPRWYRRR